jgi:hypothetical protein
MSRRAKVLDQYLDEDQEAAELRVAKRTLRTWRQKGEGPPFVRAGKQILYPIAGTVAWLKGLEQTPVRSELAAPGL